MYHQPSNGKPVVSSPPPSSSAYSHQSNNSQSAISKGSPNTFAFHTSPAPPPMKKHRYIGEQQPAQTKSSSTMRSPSSYPYTSSTYSASKYTSASSASNNPRPTSNAAGSTAKSFSIDKTISTRRAELQKLKERLRPGYKIVNTTSAATSKTNGSGPGLLALAKSQLDPSAKKTLDTKLSQNGLKSPASSHLPSSSLNNHTSSNTTAVTRSTIHKTSPTKSARKPCMSAPSPSQQFGVSMINPSQEPTDTDHSFFQSEFDDTATAPDDSLLVTPINTALGASAPATKSTKLHPRKLHLSPKHDIKEEEEVPELVSDEIKHPNLDASPTKNHSKTTSFSPSPPPPRASTMSSGKSPAKGATTQNQAPPPSSTTSSQETQETSHLEITQSNSNLTSSPSDPIKVRAEKALEDGTPIESKRGFLYVVGKYAANDSPKNEPSSNMTNVSTFTEGMSTLGMSTLGGGDARSVSTRGSTSSQNTRRLVLQLREANEEKSAALRDVARLESELESRIRQEITQQSGGVGSDGKKVQQSTVKSGALAMLICNTGRRVEKAIMRNAWHTWKKDVFGEIYDKDNSGITPSRKRALDKMDPKSPSNLSFFMGGETDVNGVDLDSNDHNNSNHRGKNKPQRNIFRSPVPKHAHEISSIPKQYLQEAFAAVVAEYSSSLAHYVIRTPTASSSKESDKFNVMPRDVYDEVVDPNLPESLEIRAHITADDSVLIVYGENSVRHVKNGSEEIVREVENVDEMGSLGIVSFIDYDGIEKEYVMDEIFEEAIASRNSYCSSLVSAALVLQTVAESKSKIMPPTTTTMPPSNATATSAPPMFQSIPNNAPPLSPKMQNNDVPPMIPPQQNIAQDMQPKPTQPPAPTIPPMNQSKGVKPPSYPSKDKKTPVTKMPPKEDKKAPASPPSPPPANALFSTLLVFLFQSIFGIVFFFTIKLPWKIFSRTIYYAFVLSILFLIWVYFANDNGAASSMSYVWTADTFRSQF